jgi:HEAT repeat protein
MREELSPPTFATQAKSAVFHARNPQVAEALQALKDKDWQVRMAAAVALEEIGPRAARAIPALIQTLERDEREDVRRAAAEALGSVDLTTMKALSALVRALDDKSNCVRWAAARTLDSFTRQSVS